MSPRTIDRLRAAGELDWLRVGGVVRIDLTSIDAYLERQRARRAEDAFLGDARQLPLARLPIPALDEVRERRRGAAVRRTEQG